VPFLETLTLIHKAFCTSTSFKEDLFRNSILETFFFFENSEWQVEIYGVWWNCSFTVTTQSSVWCHSVIFALKSISYRFAIWVIPMEQPFVLSRSENLLPFPRFLSQKPSEVFLSFFLLQAERQITISYYQAASWRGSTLVVSLHYYFFNCMVCLIITVVLVFLHTVAKECFRQTDNWALDTGSSKCLCLYTVVILLLDWTHKYEPYSNSKNLINFKILCPRCWMNY